MKAIVCEQFGPIANLRYRDIQAEDVGDYDVKIRVAYASLNFPDTLVVQGLYQVKPELPFVPVGEFSGEIISIGAKVTGLKIGDKVLGYNRIGALAEEMVLPTDYCFKKPNGVDMESAAAFIMTYATSYHGLKDRAKTQRGETLLVLGAAGGIGLAAVELGKVMGAKVIAAASSEEKLDICSEYGAEILINYQKDDLKSVVKEITQGKGVDVIVDPVGGEYAEPAVRSCAWNGRYLVVGFTSGSIPKIPMNLPLLKGCSIMGVFWSGLASNDPSRFRTNSEELVKLLGEGLLKPRIDKIYAFDNALEGFSDLAERRAKGKILVKIS